MRIIFYIFSSLILFSCSKLVDPIIEENHEQESTWEIIQSQILEPNCVACHTTGTTFAKQSDLVLTSDVAYNQLVGADPFNEAALKDGLQRIGVEGLESLAKSFLWEKINTPDYEHFYGDHPDYGSLMPLGSKSLTIGELEYIRKWILEGAPETGFVADVALLEDDSRFDPIDFEFEELPVPENGYQFHLEPFQVFAQNEREFFYYWPLNNEKSFYANRFEVSLRSGSHHFIFYNYPKESNKPEPFVYRDLRDQFGNDIFETYISIGEQILVWGTQIPKTDFTLPEGIALKVEANQGFDINTHYVNYSNEPYVGEVYANIHTIPESEVDYVAENLFLNNTELNLPPNEETVIKKSYSFGSPINILNLWSHAHKRMTEFRVYIEGGSRDGELVYYTNDWEHPPLTEFDPPLRINTNEKLRCEATYFNETSNTKSFGLLSEDEMMILFGMYY